MNGVTTRMDDKSRKGKKTVRRITSKAPTSTPLGLARALREKENWRPRYSMHDAVIIELDNR